MARPATMADIASHLGVSRQLVSIVLRDAPGASEETRRRVKEAAQELGFSAHQGAQSLRRTRSRDLGVVFSPAHSTEQEIVESIYPLAAEQGYDVILSAQTATRGTQVAVDELVGHRCAAVIVIGSDLRGTRLRTLADRTPVPVVDVGHGRKNDLYDVVHSSGDKGIAAAVDHLVALGHRRIAYLDPASMPSARLRRAGYKRAMARHGLRLDVLTSPGDYTESSYFEEVGAEVAKRLLVRRDLPTAVVSANDEAALGLLHTLVRRGVKVPEDVSVTGFDDAPLARLSSIDLTTVKQDPFLMGQAAVEAAVRRVRSPEEKPRELVVETSLVIRSSTAAPCTH